MPDTFVTRRADELADTGPVNIQPTPTHPVLAVVGAVLGVLVLVEFVVALVVIA